MTLTPITEEVKLNHQTTSDDWETPASVWKDGCGFLPDVKKVWDPFYCNGRAKVYLEDLGYDVHHEKDEDFFIVDVPEGIEAIVTNPPFTKLETAIPRLVSFNLPLVCLVPKALLTKVWFINEITKEDEWGVRPTTYKFIHFIGPKGQQGPASFECVWLLVHFKPNETKRKRKMK